MHYPVDINKLSESIARATCAALVKLLDLLANAGLTKIAVRTTIHPDNVSINTLFHREILIQYRWYCRIGPLRHMFSMVGRHLSHSVFRNHHVFQGAIFSNILVFQKLIIYLKCSLTKRRISMKIFKI